MRPYSVFVCVVVLASLALAQSPAKPSDAPGKIAESPLPSGVSVDPKLKDMFEAKIKAEWEALKNKDKKGYAELLADDYQGIEVDGRGERNKIQSVDDLTEENISNYTLWGYKLIPLGPDAALVIYESTIQFPPTAQIRYSRVYISEIWVQRAGQWKQLHYQETRVK
ncbi:MAG TPA: nuclear transport factor 2 family protein [Terriglobales bacterium]